MARHAEPFPTAGAIRSTAAPSNICFRTGTRCLGPKAGITSRVMAHETASINDDGGGVATKAVQSYDFNVRVPEDFHSLCSPRRKLRLVAMVVPRRSRMWHHRDDHRPGALWCDPNLGLFMLCYRLIPTKYRSGVQSTKCMATLEEKPAPEKRLCCGLTRNGGQSGVY